MSGELERVRAAYGIPPGVDIVAALDARGEKLERERDQALDEAACAITDAAQLAEALRELAEDYARLCGDGMTAETEPAVLRNARKALDGAE